MRPRKRRNRKQKAKDLRRYIRKKKGETTLWDPRSCNSYTDSLYSCTFLDALCFTIFFLFFLFHLPHIFYNSPNISLQNGARNFKHPRWICSCTFLPSLYPPRLPLLLLYSVLVVYYECGYFFAANAVYTSYSFLFVLYEFITLY